MKWMSQHLVATAILFISVLMLAIALSRLGIWDRLNSGLRRSDNAPSESATSSAPRPDATTAQPKQPFTRPSVGVLPIRHIEGLMLHLSRPLMFDIQGVRGLAAAPQYLYVAASNVEARTAALYRVRRDTYETDMSRSLQTGSMYDLGGIHMGAQWLWVPLSQAAPSPMSLILGLDPLTLEAKHSFYVDRQIAAVAQGADGLIYGIDADASSFHVWNTDGREIHQVPSSTGVKYTDLEIANSRVVAVGITTIEKGGNKEVCGVLDVLDPVSFALRARHLSYARSIRGNLVTGAGFALAGDEFHFLPEDGHMAMLLTYHLDGISLADYVP